MRAAEGDDRQIRTRHSPDQSIVYRVRLTIGSDHPIITGLIYNVPVSEDIVGVAFFSKITPEPPFGPSMRTVTALATVLTWSAVNARAI